MSENNYTLGRRERRIAITIPANTGNGSTVASLISGSLSDGENVISYRIAAKQPKSSTDRVAFDMADAADGFSGSNVERVPAGEAYIAYGTQSASLDYVRSTDGSTVSALVVATTLYGT